MWTAAHVIDKGSVGVSLITGIAGNIFIFLTVGTFPSSAATFHFQLLSVMDLTALCLQVSIRIIDWYGLAITGESVPEGLNIYFNVTFYSSIYANWVLVYIAMERLIALRYPSQIHVYLTVSRAKVNAVLTAILMLSFCIIVTIKMRYFGIAWLVVFTTFYTAFPLVIVFIIIWLLLGTMEEHRRDKKRQEEREKHNHHHHHHHYKDGYKTPTPGITPTSKGGHITGETRTPTAALTPTMTKSVSGLSKHSSYGVPMKHNDYIPGPTTSASRHTLTLTFTAHPKKAENISSEQESHEFLTKAKEKKELESCYTYMMLALSVTFVLLTIPYTVIEYIYVTADRKITDVFDEKQAQLFLLMIISSALMFTEHSCNFYMFFICSSKFRQQFIRLINFRHAATLETDVKEVEPNKSFV